MKKLLSIWKKQTFSAQLAIVFVIIFVVVLFFIQEITVRYQRSFQEARIEESYQQALQQTTMVLDTKLRGYKLEIDELFGNIDFVRAVKGLDTTDPEEEEETRDSLGTMMSDFLMYRTDMRTISVHTVGDSEYMADRLENDLLYPKTPELHRTYYSNEIFKDTESLKGKWVSTEYMDRKGTLEYYVFSYGKQIKDWYTNRMVGTGIVSIEEETLSDLCVNGQLNSDRSINFLFLTDAAGRVIAYGDDEILGKPYEELLTLEAGENYPEKYLILSESVPGTDWTMYSVLSRDYIFRRLNEIQKIILIFSVVLALVGVFLIALISGRMTKSIRSIVDTMNQVQKGQMNAQIAQEPKRNELAQIADHFNAMMVTINEQMEQIREAGEREKNAEIRALEAQINPHFIYNTLDSINWLALENDQEEISMMLSRFAQILRYQIAKSNKIVTIGEELVYLEHYLFLQKARFMDSFEYVVDCQESVKQEHIHKMIFQPFLENAVIHGIADLEYQGLIQVRVSEAEGGMICFRVRDNGRGMSQERVEQVFVKRTNPGNSIGVLNVLERLDIYYGDRYHIDVKSEEGKGTDIEVIIPKL